MPSRAQAQPATPKLVYVIRSAQVGGVEQHVIDLIQALRHRYSIELVSLTDEPAHESFLNLGIPLHQLKGRTVQHWSALSNLGDLLRKFRELAPDVVHLHGIRPMFFGALAARRAGVRRIVSTVHSSHRLMAMNEAGRVQPLKLLISKFMHLLGIAGSTHVITVSRQLEAELAGILRRFLLLPWWLNHAKLRTIYNGIALEHFWRDALPEPDPAREVTVGYIGRLDPKKGVDDLIEALAQLRRRGCRVRLQVVGTGWYREKLEPQVRQAQLEPDVTFLGHRTDIAQLARGFDVFVLPSWSEGLPLSVMEMMAVGLPIVATRVGGIPEQVLDGLNGLLVPPRAPDQLAAAIEKLVQRPDLRQAYAREGQARARLLFDARTMLESIAAVYSG